MSKYSVEFKLEGVKYYLKRHGYGKTAKYFKLPDFIYVRKWVRPYQAHGNAGLLKNHISSHSGEFKINVIK